MKVQKESNPPIPGLKLLAKVKKSHPMSRHVPGPVAQGTLAKKPKLIVCHFGTQIRTCTVKYC